MNRKEFTDFVEKTLYEIDPANTYCNENEMYGEYSSEATMIATCFIDSGMLLLRSMSDVFDEMFGKSYDEKKLLEAYRIVNEELC